MLNGLMSPSAASFALTLAVMAASSTWVPVVLVELQALSDSASTSARQTTDKRSNKWLRFIASSSSRLTSSLLLSPWHQIHAHRVVLKQNLCHGLLCPGHE